MSSSAEFSTLVSDEDKLVLEEHATPTSLPSAWSYLSLLFCVVSLSVDYSVIMPSLWIFLRSIDPDVNEALLGVTLSVFQLASVLFSPLMGYWLDHRPMKEIVVFQLWISICGNISYSLSTTVWQVVLSRFVCGIGSTVGLCATVYVIRTTTTENRSGAFSKLNGSTLLGLLFGPAFNYPLTQLPHFTFLGVTITSLNAAGLMMTIFLFIAIGLIHLLFQEPPRVVSSEEMEDKQISWVEKVKSIASFASIALACCLFVSSMNQLALETSLPPVTLLLWQFAQLENSLMYTGLTVYLLIWYVLLGVLLTRKLSDRVLLLIAWLCVGGGTAFLLVSGFLQGGIWLFWQFCVGAAVIATSIPFFDSSGTSLFSKMQKPRLQGRAQSFLSSVRGMGVLVGPLAAAPLLEKGPIWVFVMVGGCFAIAFPFFLLSFRLLRLDDAKVIEVDEDGAKDNEVN